VIASSPGSSEFLKYGKEGKLYILMTFHMALVLPRSGKESRQGMVVFILAFKCHIMASLQNPKPQKS
jgi:hypothetical protein